MHVLGERVSEILARIPLARQLTADMQRDYRLAVAEKRRAAAKRRKEAWRAPILPFPETSRPATDSDPRH